MTGAADVHRVCFRTCVFDTPSRACYVLALSRSCYVLALIRALCIAPSACNVDGTSVCRPEEAEANCTVDELLSALRKTHPAMTVEESALQAFLKVLDQKDDFIDIVRGVIEMAAEFDDDE